MSDIAVRAERLGKIYRIGSKPGGYKTLRDTLADAMVAPFRRMLMLGAQRSAPSDTIWALKDVSLEIKRGEVIGIIGRNGAGKSTLLKILSRITEPTTGFAEIQGRVGSLLEVGTGFHPELTGRENIYLNGAILGMKRAEINRKFDEIVAFAEVEKFIDTPVKHYSSGMYLRLAFAVAAHLDPEIMLVDEVLAVGDATFQKKCLGKMQNVAQEGRTVLFVSHNMGAIVQLCERALWIEDGQLKLTGSPSSVVASYLSSGIVSCPTWNPSVDGLNDREFQVKCARILSNERQPTAVIEYSSSFKVEIAYEVTHLIKDLSVVCRLTDSHGNVVCTSWDTDPIGWKNGQPRNPGRYLSTCKIPARLLRPGRYYVSIGALNSERKIDSHENVLRFEVSEAGYHLNPDRIGIIAPLLEWKIKRMNEGLN